MTKYVILVLSLYLLSGCTLSTTNSLHKSKIYDPTSKQFVSDYYTKDVAEEMKSVDNAFFVEKEDSETNSFLEMSDAQLLKFSKKNKEYHTIDEVYGAVVASQDLHSYNLKASDYLSLYKLLNVSQPNYFKKYKENIIDRFMIEIEDYVDLDFNSIYKAMIAEEFDKLNNLRMELIAMEAKNL